MAAMTVRDGAMTRKNDAKNTKEQRKVGAMGTPWVGSSDAGQSQKSQARTAEQLSH